MPYASVAPLVCTLSSFLQQLDVEVEYMEKSWETLRGVQDRLEVKELKGGAVKEEDLSELLKLRKTVKNKIHESESILDLTSSFHLTSQQVGGAGRKLFCQETSLRNIPCFTRTS